MRESCFSYAPYAPDAVDAKHCATRWMCARFPRTADGAYPIRRGVRGVTTGTGRRLLPS
jgi:hypothetical protein